MEIMLDNGIIESHPPLADVKGSYTAQFEHVSLYLTLKEGVGMSGD